MQEACQSVTDIQQGDLAVSSTLQKKNMSRSQFDPSGVSGEKVLREKLVQLNADLFWLPTQEEDGDQYMTRTSSLSLGESVWPGGKALGW